MRGSGLLSSQVQLKKATSPPSPEFCINMYVYMSIYLSQEGPLGPGPSGPRGAQKGPAHKGPARKGPGGPTSAQGGPQGPGPHGRAARKGKK